jgi:hypothetical protein
MPTRLLAFGAIGLLGTAILSVAQPPASAGATRIIAREGPRKLIAIPPSGGKPRTLFRLRKGALLSTGVSSGGTEVAFASRTWDKSSAIPVWTDRIWMMRGGRRAHAIKSFVRPRSRAGSQIDSIALSPDGRHILIAKRNGATFILRADGAHLRQVVVPGYSFGVGGGRNSSGPEFTPDGRRIIGIFYPVGADEDDIGGIGTTSIDGGRIHFLRVGRFRYGVGFAFAPTISPDGRCIAFVTADKAGYRVVIMRRNGSAAHSLAGTQMSRWAIQNPSFSPSGDALTFAGEKMTAGGVVLGVAPSIIFTVRRDGTARQTVQREKAHRGARNPIWTRWPY